MSTYAFAPQWLTVKGVASYSGLSARTIPNLAKDDFVVSSWPMCRGAERGGPLISRQSLDSWSEVDLNRYADTNLKCDTRPAEGRNIVSVMSQLLGTSEARSVTATDAGAHPSRQRQTRGNIVPRPPIFPLSPTFSMVLLNSETPSLHSHVFIKFMINKTAITYPEGLKIEPDFFRDPQHYGANHHLPRVDVKPKFKWNSRAQKIICILHGAIIATAEERQDGWHITRIGFNPGRLLYGHNGRTLLCDKEIAWGLSRLKSIVCRLLVPGQEHSIVPGMDTKSSSFFSSLDINRHLPDPDRNLLTAFMNIRHSAIRKAHLLYHGEGFALKGKYAQLSIDAVDIQMSDFLQSQGVDDVTPLLRVGVVLRGEMLGKYVHNCDSFCNIEQKNRLVRFTITDLHAAYLKFIRETTGVMALRDDHEVKGIGGFLAQTAKHWDIPLASLLKVYVKTKPISGTKAVSEVYREAHAHLARLSEWTVDELFSEESFYIQPQIEVPRLERKLPPFTAFELSCAREIWWVYTNQAANGNPSLPKTIAFDMAI